MKISPRLTIGVFFGFEVKEPGEEPTEIQDETIKDIAKAGGITARVRTAADIDAAIAEWRHRL